MREKGIVTVIILIVVLLVGLAVAGFIFLNPKARMERAAAPDTSTEESVRDKVAPRNEIKESGYNLKVVIEPSDNNIISDTVTITASEVNKQAAGVGFFISDNKESLQEGGMTSIGTDASSTDGWSSTFNTTEFGNGKYYISVVVYNEGGEGPPLGAAQIPVEISN